jgi:hypothetical protein
MDAENKIDVISADLDLRLQLFTEYQNFQEARIFKQNDSTYVLEISYKVDNKLSRYRLPMNLVQYEDFRAKVTLRLKDEKPMLTINQEGRSEFLTGTTLLALGYYGWAIPTGFEMNDARANVFIYLTAGGMGFLIPYISTRHSTVTYAMSSLSIWGGMMGIFHGICLYDLLKGDRNVDGNGLLLAGSVASLSELIVGYNIAKSTNMEPGKASMISLMGTNGILYGVGLSEMFNMNNSNNIGWSSLGLLGSFGGMFVGNAMANSQYYTRGDATVVTNTTILGYLVPLSALVVADANNSGKSLWWGLTLSGATLGTITGALLVKNEDFTSSHGTYITLSTLAGDLFGSGLGYLISGNNDQNTGKVVFGLGTVGAIAGFAIMYGSLKDEAAVPGTRGALDFNVSPLGLYSMMNKNRSTFGKNAYIPLMQVQYKF